MDQLINEMAEAAFDNFEFSCEWSKARVAAKERAQELRKSVSASDITLAVNIARMQWDHESRKAKNFSR